MSALGGERDVHQRLGGVEAGEDGDEVGGVVVPAQREELGARTVRWRLPTTATTATLARHGSRLPTLK